MIFLRVLLTPESSTLPLHWIMSLIFHISSLLLLLVPLPNHTEQIFYIISYKDILVLLRLVFVSLLSYINDSHMHAREVFSDIYMNCFWTSASAASHPHIHTQRKKDIFGGFFALLLPLVLIHNILYELVILKCALLWHEKQRLICASITCAHSYACLLVHEINYLTKISWDDWESVAETYKGEKEEEDVHTDTHTHTHQTAKMCRNKCQFNLV